LTFAITTTSLTSTRRTLVPVLKHNSTRTNNCYKSSKFHFYIMSFILSLSSLSDFHSVIYRPSDQFQ